MKLKNVKCGELTIKDILNDLNNLYLDNKDNEGDIMHRKIEYYLEELDE